MMNRIQSLDLSGLAAQAVYAARQTYAEQQRNQMFDGIANDGRAIAPRYSAKYAAWKAAHYPNLPRHVSLHLSGYFQSRITLEVNGSKIEMLSEDHEKDGWLTGQYGERIWGLYGKYKKPFNKRVKSEYSFLIKKDLGI